MRTALTLNDKFTPLRKSVEFDEYWDEDVLCPAKYLEAKKKLLEIAHLANSGGWNKDCVVLDSLTGLCRAVQLYIMSLGSKSGSGYSLGVPQIQHYGLMVNEVESILTILRSMKCLVLATAHEMLIEVDDDSNPNKPPEIFTYILSATKPHGVNKIPWLFDEVLHTSTRPAGQGKNIYMLTGQRTRTIVARTRSGIGDVNFGDEGLYGLLKRMSYEYKPAKLEEPK
jgi:hypothetical protein